MATRRKAKGRFSKTEIEKHIAELRRKPGVNLIVLKHKWPTSKKIIVIMGANT